MQLCLKRGWGLRQRRSFYSGLLAVFLVLCVVMYEDFGQANAHQHSIHIRVLDKLTTIRAQLEAELNGRLSLAHGVAALVKSNPQFTQEDFDVFAQDMIEGSDGVRSLQLAPNAVVSYIYPLKGNASALGHDLLADPAQKDSVLKSIEDHKFLVAGPLNLLQGGVGVIGRHPIYHTVETTDGSTEQFWGFSSILLDLEPLLKKSGLSSDRVDELQVALRGKDGMGADGDVFFGETSVFRNSPILQDVSLPNGSWQLAAIPNGGWSVARPGRVLFLVIGFGISICIGSLFYVLVQRASDLKSEVDEHLSTGTALKLAKRDADKANLSKSEFLASMSHELRTPLNAVLGFAQMLQYSPKDELTSVQMEYVESILEGGNHLLVLVNEILDLAKIESDQVSLQLEDLNPETVIAECVALTKPLIDMKNINFVQKVKPKSSVVLHTDRQRLKQIILNLLSNAVKYNVDGGQVVVDSQTTPDDFLCISVQDTGVGIAQSHFESVFEMFNRGGADPMVAQEGTGIGLAVTRRLIERMGGEIGFDSVEGEGSTFWFKVPLKFNRKVLVWTENLRIGVDAIDKDHQMLFSLLNKVLHSELTPVDLNVVLSNLVDYTQFHFRCEEKVMEICNMPGFEAHKAEHAEIAAKVGRFVEAWSLETNPEKLEQFHEMFREWFLEHVRTDDVEISQHVKGFEYKIGAAMAEMAVTNHS